jgi:hypothetical protein
MKRFAVSATTVAAVLLWLSGCKSGTTSPSDTTPDYMPMKTGNYWVYERYDLDSSGNRSGGPYTDSVVVGVATQVAGRTAYPYYTYSSDNPGPDTTYYSKDADGSIWQYMSFSAGTEFGLPEIPARWVKVTSASSETSWTVLDTTFTVLIPNVPIPVTVQFKATGAKAGSESLTLGGKSYTAQKFTQTVTISVAGIANANLTNTTSFVSTIGNAKSRMTYTATIPGSPNEAGGSEQVLVRWKVN